MSLMDCNTFLQFVIGRARSQGDVTCRLCKQQYRDHIGSEKICPWPEEHPKPEHLSKDADNE